MEINLTISTNKPQAVLFDLDGTLLDTAPDLVFALNLLRKEHGLDEELPLSTLRSIISYGSREMIKAVLKIDVDHPHFAQIREHFLELYQKHLADKTQLFPQIEEVLVHLEKQQIPWGIVTNKLTKQTMALLKALRLDHRPGCIICGDSLPTYKPDPAPIRYACQLLQRDPNHCIYVGDSITDVLASKAAGTKSLVAMYGYIGEDDNPSEWQADGYINEPIDIIKWL